MLKTHTTRQEIFATINALCREENVEQIIFCVNSDGTYFEDLEIGNLKLMSVELTAELDGETETHAVRDWIEKSCEIYAERREEIEDAGYGVEDYWVMNFTMKFGEAFSIEVTEQTYEDEEEEHEFTQDGMLDMISSAFAEADLPQDDIL
jgi:hypothetical protein